MSYQYIKASKILSIYKELKQNWWLYSIFSQNHCPYLQCLTDFPIAIIKQEM